MATDTPSDAPHSAGELGRRPMRWLKAWGGIHARDPLQGAGLEPAALVTISILAHCIFTPYSVFLNREWVEGVEARAQATQYRLEGELAGYKTNLIKESIRMGHHELADFFYERGDLQVWDSARASCFPSQLFPVCWACVHFMMQSSRGSVSSLTAGMATEMVLAKT